jgi:hypothetical protein
MKKHSCGLIMMISIVIIFILGSCNKDNEPCIPNELDCNWSTDGGANWIASLSPSIVSGKTLQIKISPDSGMWSWTGPNGFTATTRQIELRNITSAMAGEYVVTNTAEGGCTSSDTLTVSVTPGNYKVAYFAFDATPEGQDRKSLVNFTDNANVVVVFEGKLWELADSAHYGNSKSYILSRSGGVYKYYKQIIDDIHTLQARGIKVLMNVDDTESWQTKTPFAEYSSINYKQLADSVAKWCAKVPFDGIALDVEHFSGPANSNYVDLIREFGKYFGPRSSNPGTIYTAAIYNGAEAGDALGKSTINSTYFDFVMDMGYFDTQNINRFTQYSKVIGTAKVMNGMSYQYNKQTDAISNVKWMKSVGAAGVMVFAGNVNKPYTDAIFSALDAK